MKRLIALFCLLTVGLFFAQAQKETEADKMVKARMDNMKANLKLNEDEAKSFWSAYEQFLRSEVKCLETYKQNLAKQDIHLKEHGKNKEIIAKLSSKQLTYLQDQKFELRKKLLDLETNFYKKLKTFLTPYRIQSFYNIEEQYKRNMVNKKKHDETQPASTTTPSNVGKKRR